MSFSRYFVFLSSPPLKTTSKQANKQTKNNNKNKQKMRTTTKQKQQN